MKATIPRLELSREQLQKLVEHARTEPLSEEEYTQLKAAIETLGYITQLVEDKDTTIQRLRQILFGASTEKTDKVLKQVLNEEGSRQPAKAEGDPTQASAKDVEAEAGAEALKGRPKGHGRNGAQAYTGGNKVQVSHGSLKRGDRCPGCQKGKVYELNTPGVVVRVTGRRRWGRRYMSCRSCAAICAARCTRPKPRTGWARRSMTSGRRAWWRC